MLLSNDKAFEFVRLLYMPRGDWVPTDCVQIVTYCDNSVAAYKATDVYWMAAETVAAVVHH